MNEIGKRTKKLNVVCTIAAFAILILIFALEIWQYQLYQDSLPKNDDDWGHGLIILAIIVLCVYSALPLGVGAILQLISTVGIYKSQTKARGFLIVGIVGKFFTAVTLLVFTGLLIYAEVYGVVTKVFYIAFAIGYIVISALQIKLSKQMKNAN